MIALLLALPFADVTASAVADRTAIRLSERVRLTLTVEGPAPLAVSVPDEWLVAESAASWRARVTGPAVVSPLADGRERWSMTLRLDPYATGDPLPVSLNGALVRAGTDATARRVDWSPPAIHVTSEIGDTSADDARPVTGVEAIPVAARATLWPWVAATFLAVLLAVAVFVRTRVKPNRVFDHGEIAAQSIRDVEAETDPRELARLVAGAVRQSLGREFAFRSTGEIGRELERDTSAQDDADAASLLTLCDRVHFDPTAAGLADELKSRALDWLRSR